MSYEQHKKMICKLAWKYQGPTVDFDDLMSVGNEAYVRAERNFDPSRGVKLSTLVHTYVERDMRSHAQKECKQRSKSVAFDEDQFPAVTQPRPLPLFGLSEEAMHVIRMIFEAPGELLELQGDRGGAAVKWSDFCRVMAPKTNLTWSTLKSIFYEIKAVL